MTRIELLDQDPPQTFDGVPKDALPERLRPYLTRGTRTLQRQVHSIENGIITQVWRRIERGAEPHRFTLRFPEEEL